MTPCAPLGGKGVWMGRPRASTCPLNEAPLPTHPFSLSSMHGAKSEQRVGERHLWQASTCPSGLQNMKPCTHLGNTDSRMLANSGERAAAHSAGADPPTSSKGGLPTLSHPPETTKSSPTTTLDASVGLFPSTSPLALPAAARAPCGVPFARRAVVRTARSLRPRPPHPGNEGALPAPGVQRRRLVLLGRGLLRRESSESKANSNGPTWNPS